ncbi:Protoheme IX farnesyltransferase [Buchnera aphidicola (Cinara pseudotaxifoliae)]|uniref:Protoheme IX farnesyltransferase n=1 Tax=Buchnera aphidicola (Cinara pseudotaxifoliae) TaxID=655384 RepID=A0A451DHK4_9GAMM|nr:protoheme IX farnesyltransferase [Buchnera aphidicola]VFP86090.1 Protoheme IX farnesyltransferase [Buchnera aphidicola (Cinara pseudotaxifoliae)]
MDFRSFKSLILKFFFFIKKYKITQIFELIKPGIILGNIISLSGGFFLASRGELLKILFLKVILGMICIISSSCIFNNIIDRKLDKKMNRTKNRILCIHASNELLFILFMLALFLCCLGLYIFFKYISFLCTIISIVGIFFYVILYSLWLKKKSCYSVLIGSISGSLPPIIGYVSVSNTFDRCCMILFFMFVFWQIAHACSILLYRYKDYTNANIPTIPKIYGIKYTKLCISVCITSVFLLNLLLYYFDYIFFSSCLHINICVFCWLLFSFMNENYFFSHKKWSRIMFFLSIFIIFFISIVLSLNFVNGYFSKTVAVGW